MRSTPVDATRDAVAPTTSNLSAGPRSLLTIVQSAIDQAAISRLAESLGQSPARTRSAVDAILPTLVIALISAFARRSRRVEAAIRSADVGILGPLPDPPGPCRGAAVSLERILGTQLTAQLAARSARYGQIDTETAHRLLVLLTPMVLASAKLLVQQRGIDADGWSGKSGPDAANLLSRPALEPSVLFPKGCSDAEPAVAIARLTVTAPRYGLLLVLAWSALLAFWASAGSGSSGWRAAFEPARDPRLSVINVGSQVQYSGVVGDEQTRAAVRDAFVAVYGDERVIGDMGVDQNMLPARWLQSLELAAMLSRKPGLELQLSNDWVEVAGLKGEVDRKRMVDVMRAVFHEGYRVVGRSPDVGPPSPERLARARASLTELGDRYVFSDFETVLRAWVIHFPAESDEIPDDQRALIRGAARLMRQLPEGVMIEIQGHTDDQGDTEVNQVLSRVRAESVREALIDAGAPPSRLRAQGYGSSKPVASNTEPAGRRLNRRIEFVVVRE